MKQQAKTELLLSQQQKGVGLLLPNAWDVASARLFEKAGFTDLGTTSAGIAFALGYPDGERIKREEMLQVICPVIVGQGAALPRHWPGHSA